MPTKQSIMKWNIIQHCTVIITNDLLAKLVNNSAEAQVYVISSCIMQSFWEHTYIM